MTLRSRSTCYAEAVDGAVSGRAFVLGQELGSGREGHVYQVEGESGLCAKILDASDNHAAQVRRLRGLLAVESSHWTVGRHIEVAWPVALCRDGDDVVGYFMNLIGKPDHVPLDSLLSSSSQHRAAGHFTWATCVSYAADLARVVDKLHEADFVVGDLAFENIFASTDGRITLIDVDSFQFTHENERFRATTWHAEHGAPELMAQGHNAWRDPSTDNFSLAVMVVLLLLEQYHPFACVPTNASRDADRDDWETTNIALGMSWVTKPERVVPDAWRPNPKILPPNVRALLKRAFDRGQQFDRPTATEWVRALEATAASLATCSSNNRHIFPKHLAHCPWCERAQLTRRDPYPAVADAEGNVLAAPPTWLIPQQPTIKKGSNPSPTPRSEAPKPAAGAHGPSQTTTASHAETPELRLPSRRFAWFTAAVIFVISMLVVTHAGNHGSHWALNPRPVDLLISVMLGLVAGVGSALVAPALIREGGKYRPLTDEESVKYRIEISKNRDVRISKGIRRIAAAVAIAGLAVTAVGFAGLWPHASSKPSQRSGRSQNSILRAVQVGQCINLYGDLDDRTPVSNGPAGIVPCASKAATYRILKVKHSKGGRSQCARGLGPGWKFYTDSGRRICASRFVRVGQCSRATRSGYYSGSVVPCSSKALSDSKYLGKVLWRIGRHHRRCPLKRAFYRVSAGHGRRFCVRAFRVKR